MNFIFPLLVAVGLASNPAPKELVKPNLLPISLEDVSNCSFPTEEEWAQNCAPRKPKGPKARRDYSQYKNCLFPNGGKNTVARTGETSSDDESFQDVADKQVLPSVIDNSHNPVKSVRSQAKEHGAWSPEVMAALRSVIRDNGKFKHNGRRK
ncbi:MAG: hypothetical protein NTU89_00720 [Candidatus Dependentiae bacterium]|nr:hypothetical protein [Candidatus Dependentiae bacterium]